MFMITDLYFRPPSTEKPVKSVLQDWVMELGLRHQGVLLGALRGCDTAPKNDPSKLVTRCYRGEVLHSFAKNPSSYIEVVGIDALTDRMTAFLRDCDQYPQHYVTHLLHAAEILGYKKPAPPWSWFYFKLCKGLHVNPETVEQLDERLLANEKDFTQMALIEPPPKPAPAGGSAWKELCYAITAWKATHDSIDPNRLYLPREFEARLRRDRASLFDGSYRPKQILGMRVSYDSMMLQVSFVGDPDR